MTLIPFSAFLVFLTATGMAGADIKHVVFDSQAKTREKFATEYVPTLMHDFPVSEHKWTLKELNPDLPSDWSSFKFLVLEVKASTAQRFLLRLYTADGMRALRFHQFPQSPTAQIRARRELLLFGEPLRRLADAAPVDAVDGHDRSGAVFHFPPLGPRSQSASSSRRSTRRSGAGSCEGRASMGSSISESAGPARSLRRLRERTRSSEQLTVMR